MTEREQERAAVVADEFPGGAPDRETFDIMERLSDLQVWCVMMARKDSGGVPASRLIQDVRAYIVERTYPAAMAYRASRASGDHIGKE